MNPKIMYYPAGDKYLFKVSAIAGGLCNDQGLPLIANSWFGGEESSPAPSEAEGEGPGGARGDPNERDTRGLTPSRQGHVCELCPSPSLPTPQDTPLPLPSASPAGRPSDEDCSAR